MGTVTAFYALGATIAPYFLNLGLEHGGLTTALSGAAIVYLCAGLIAGVLFLRAGARYANATKAQAGVSSLSFSAQGILWFGYGSGALAGLMVIGHASAIVQSVGGATTLAIAGTTGIAFANMLGGLSAGALSDRIRIEYLLIGLPLVSACALFVGGAVDFAAPIVVVLIFVGFTYGAIIAVYPVVVLKLAGTAASARIYGRVFTSWGTAGLIGPWLAGSMYDRTSDYTNAILAAAIVSLLSVVAAVVLGRLSIVLPDKRESANP